MDVRLFEEEGPDWVFGRVGGREQSDCNGPDILVEKQATALHPLLNPPINVIRSCRLSHSVPQSQPGHEEHTAERHVQTGHGSEQLEQPDQNVNARPLDVLPSETTRHHQANEVYFSQVAAHGMQPHCGHGLFYRVQSGGLHYCEPERHWERYVQKCVL